jgi:uncharacterized tellurite resistance protein B-like protein
MAKRIKEKSLRTRKPRLNGPLIKWAAVVGGVGLLALIGAAAPGLRFAPPDGFAFQAGASYLPAVAAGGALLAASLLFGILGCTALRASGAELDADEKLIVRVASAMVVADGDAAEVEVQALRTWIRRRFGFDFFYDELFRIAQDNKNSRAGIIRSVAERRTPPTKWGAQRDHELIEACKHVIVSDLRVREDELKYLRELSELIGLPKELIDKREVEIKALKHTMVNIVVEDMLDEQRIKAAMNAAA